MSRIPDRWDSMSDGERGTWKRQQAERQDLEYDRDRLQRRAEQAERDEQDAVRTARAQHAEYANALDAAEEQRRQAEREVILCRTFLTERGLLPDFDDWASYRREE